MERPQPALMTLATGPVDAQMAASKCEGMFRSTTYPFSCKGIGICRYLYIYIDIRIYIYIYYIYYIYIIYIWIQYLDLWIDIWMDGKIDERTDGRLDGSLHARPGAHGSHWPQCYQIQAQHHPGCQCCPWVCTNLQDSMPWAHQMYLQGGCWEGAEKILRISQLCVCVYIYI